MLDSSKPNKVYLACGVTDMRKSINGLANLVQENIKLDPFEKAYFVFCNNVRLTNAYYSIWNIYHDMFIRFHGHSHNLF